jgi:cystathionine gamma-synthase
VNVRIVEQRLISENVLASTDGMPAVTLYIVVFPLELSRVAKTFWQHSGHIISSRQAEHCLSLMNANERVMLDSVGEHMQQQRARNPLYFAKGPLASSPAESPVASSPVEGKDLDDYVEQRFGRILDVSMADKAKRLLRRRIAGVVSPDQDDCTPDPVDREVAGLAEEHVYLLPCGMNAIYTSFIIASKIYPDRKSVQFGYVPLFLMIS